MKSNTLNQLENIGLDLSDSLTAAPKILGYKLIVNTPKGKTSGIIVETEAYRFDDPASHSFMGLTKRNGSLFEEAGTIYVYFTYGMHYCVNVVTGAKDSGQAVLIRAIEPIEGIDLMMKRRGLNRINGLTNGPAKLTQAMGIGRAQNGTNISDGTISIETGIKPKDIVISPRIGISKAKDQPWRFYIEGNHFVSNGRLAKAV